MHITEEADGENFSWINSKKFIAEPYFQNKLKDEKYKNKIYKYNIYKMFFVSLALQFILYLYH